MSQQTLHDAITALAERLAPVYAAKRWKWAERADTAHYRMHQNLFIPDSHQIADRLWELLGEMRERHKDQGNPTPSLGTGRLIVIFDADAGDCEIGLERGYRLKCPDPDTLFVSVPLAEALEADGTSPVPTSSSAFASDGSSRQSSSAG